MSVNKTPRRKRLVISDAAVPFVARGGRVFGRQVIDADLDIVDGEEVLVVDRNDRVITTTRAIL
ncbi:MAG: pseudouridine synthase [Methanothrix harundinacea]|uniref:PUA domain containing protein n=1 Tax=Methanothrix harundinacea TaxID=301375 RepID=A0A101FRX9_9EURY|nr:MAG: PUA domain containing protein [Methanothrix harundinacea]KUK96196.1 MAG: PUA domain containing protein [Methanothrix harundinacea]MCP1391399.1 pseudouridine synthase [Methanothrix harundinacea]